MKNRDNQEFQERLKKVAQNVIEIIQRESEQKNKKEENKEKEGTERY